MNFNEGSNELNKNRNKTRKLDGSSLHLPKLPTTFTSAWWGEGWNLEIFHKKVPHNTFLFVRREEVGAIFYENPSEPNLYVS